MSLLQQAIEFRTAMEQPLGDYSLKVSDFQWSLIDEEFDEFSEAEDNSENELKELGDLVYVCFQYAAAKGWDLETAINRIHTSNMSKQVDGVFIKNEEGKVLKGPNYQPPDLSDLV